MTLAQRHYKRLTWLFAAASLAYLVVSQMSYSDAQVQGQTECAMVKVWYQSGHRNGWPPQNEWERRNCR